MQPAQKKTGSKKPAKTKAGEVVGDKDSLIASKQDLEHRIKALKKIIKQLSDEEKPKDESL